jgi:ubiquinone/menaquinone biosynthesis C-methylase UbiE
MLEAESTTGVPALAMLKQTGLLPSPPSQAKILDNACGSGVVAKRFFKNMATSEPDFKLLCGDLDQTMVNMTSDSIKEKGWKNVTVDRIDAHAACFTDGEFSHVLMNFGPQLMSDAEEALRRIWFFALEA